MDADCVKKLLPDEYLRAFLDKGVREDNRKLPQHREVKVSIGFLLICLCMCNVITLIGVTCANCTISAKMVKSTVGIQAPAEYKRPPPMIEYTFDEQMEEIPEGCDKWDRIKENSLLISHLNTIFTHFHKQNQESFQIAGKMSWHLKATLKASNNDGNIEAALTLAFILALQKLLLPGVIIDPKTKTVTKDEKKRVRLLQNGVKPIFPFTFTSVLDKYIILDATAFELQCKSTTFTHILLDDQLLIIKNGAETLPFAVLAETAKLSKQLMTELFYRGLAEILADDAAVQLKVLTASV